MEIRNFDTKSHRGPQAKSFSWALLSPRCWPQWLGLVFLSLLWLILPITWRDALGKGLGRLISKGRWPRRIPTNLSLCFPGLSDREKQAIVLEHCQAQACVVLDLPALWMSSPKRQLQRTRVLGLEHLESEYAASRSVCLLVCHSLGMEHAARALKWSYPMLGYYQPFGATLVDWLFYRFRTKNGGYLIQRGDSLRQLVRDLRDGWMLYMMIDEDMGEAEGHWVDFFATEKCGIKAPAKMVALTGASALPVYSWYDLKTRRYEIRILPALSDFPSGDEKADVQRLMSSLQSMVELQPAQYGWRQKLFRSRRQSKK